MATLVDQINDSISVLARLSMAFSAQDVATYAGWDGYEDSEPPFPLGGTVEQELRVNCENREIVRLDTSEDTSLPHRYLGVHVARRWWIASTLRWAETDIECVTAAQLAAVMSVAFDKRRWSTPPASLLSIGRELALVADGALPETFVFPWATLLRSNPHLVDTFYTVVVLPSPFHRFASSPSAKVNDGFNAGKTDVQGSLTLDGSLDLPLYSVVAQGLWQLSDRQARILQLRLGLLRNCRRHTLEEIGHHFGVTRERIRQIEKKALKKFRCLAPSRQFRLAFATEFIRTEGSLIIPESSMTPWHTLLYEMFGLNVMPIEELGLGIVTNKDLSEYRTNLIQDESQKSTSMLLPFLSNFDAKRLHVEEETHWRKKRRTRPYMIREALRSLGRAAHYQEIAEECNRLFPDNRTTTHSWHAAMSLPSSEPLGIVWIGRKGVYGLKEHGYAKPEKDLFESVADIVERIYSETEQPVLDEVVIVELGRQRRELNPTSVRMALGFNSRVEAVGSGRYIPRSAFKDSGDPSGSHLDISAAFAAFSAAEDGLES